MKYEIKWYRLDEDRNPVACSLEEWCEWRQTPGEPWRVAQTWLDDKRVRVSTVFLGNDHRFFGDGPPILFETMIFGGPHDEYQRRYCAWEEAVGGHDYAVMLAEGKVEEDE